ncbi:hypothetical protein I0E98_10650 [Pseudomonas lalucatii]|nr:hypothetical protein [Pseudomonas lalucatii]
MERTKFTIRQSGFSPANAIYIIDCLGENDLQTGHRRLQGIHDLLQEMDPGRFVELQPFVRRFSAGTAKAFAAAIDEILNLTAQGIHPILFIDGHGRADKGLRLPSNEYLPWQDLLQHCHRIIQLCAGELSVIVAACHSMAAIKHLDLNTRLPFAFYYGYPSTVAAGVILDETQLICKSLLQDGGKTAMEAKLKLRKYSEYDHIQDILAMALLLSSAPHISAECMPELSRAKLRRVSEETAISLGMRLAGMRRQLNAMLNSGKVAISLVNRLMYDTPRRKRLIEDICRHIES